VFADAREVPEGTRITADVCVIGAGAAGITLARELSAPNRRVVVLESGFSEPDAATQTLYDGDSLGIPYFALGDPSTRTRQFGGSTNQWNGECRPLTAYDFVARPWLPESGWPFDLDELLPYYDRAQAVCELGPYSYAAPDPALDGTVEPTVIQYSPPTRFGPAMHDAFASETGTTVYVGANVVELTPVASARALEHVVVATLSGTRFVVRAGAFVLATGGIENARLLLLSDRVVRGGIGNAHDLVGRFFMEHLYVDHAATVDVARGFRGRYGRDQWTGSARVRYALTLSEATQRADQLPGTTFVLGGVPTPTRPRGRLREVVRRAAVATRTSTRVPVKHIQEQVPNRASRVVLASDCDQLGARHAALDWRVSAIDKRSAARSHGVLDRALRAAGVGRVVASRLDDGPDWPAGLRGARHHMGTTRIHPDPKRGVVDTDCRVHGVANLYVAGSSVFPTSGTANPTLTIVALALRLADHLKSVAS